MSEYKLRLKLLLKDRTAGICYIVASVVILIVILGLIIHAEERSSLPIGLVLEDHSDKAAELAERIRTTEALYVYENDLGSLYDMLLDGYINCIFVVKKGYGDSLTDGDPIEVLSIYAAEDDKISTVISDIVAGCMMYEVCLDKAYKRYQGLEAPSEDYVKMTYAEYAGYVKKMAEDDTFRFVFDATYVDAGTGKISTSDITNGMIYRQMIAGMLAMLMMLVAFCSFNSVVSEYENGIRSRLRTIAGSPLIRSIREIAAAATYCLPAAILISAMLIKQTGVAASLWIFLLDLAFILFFCIMFYVFTILCRNVFAYQLLGTVSVTVLGAMGFISAFRGLIGDDLFINTPVAVYIDMFIKAINQI